MNCNDAFKWRSSVSNHDRENTTYSTTGSIPSASCNKPNGRSGRSGTETEVSISPLALCDNELSNKEQAIKSPGHQSGVATVDGKEKLTIEAREQEQRWAQVM